MPWPDRPRADPHPAAGGTTWDKTPRLPQVSAYDDDLRTMAYPVIDAIGLQRGRITAGRGYPPFAFAPFRAALRSSGVEVGLGGGLRTTWG
ncbi:hypothetical protein SAV14893_082200 [Streptomyces avermitilis]|uniref:Uncharacterized protein n=1 Tax=Streptomyces avermitilis TaxID=33903 RepID=A0A4D4MBN2_STRAX|nr:hypothetical protein SAV14893_082200 [Streptomyces avermitilis]